MTVSRLTRSDAALRDMARGDVSEAAWKHVPLDVDEIEARFAPRDLTDAERAKYRAYVKQGITQLAGWLDRRRTRAVR